MIKLRAEHTARPLIRRRVLTGGFVWFKQLDLSTVFMTRGLVHGVVHLKGLNFTPLHHPTEIKLLR